MNESLKLQIKSLKKAINNCRGYFFSEENSFQVIQALEELDKLEKLLENETRN